MTALPAVRRRAGFSMIEMIFAVSITVLVFSIAIPFFQAQTRALDAGAGRLDAFQSARYAVARIEADLRSAGGEVGQPLIVQAAPFAIAFNANRQGRTPASVPNTSYWDASLDTLTTASLMVSSAAAVEMPASSDSAAKVQAIVLLFIVLSSQRFIFIGYLAVCLTRSSGASLPPPRLRQFVVFGTTPS